MFVIHKVQLQEVCGSDNWMTPREGEKHEKAFHGGCGALWKASQQPAEDGAQQAPWQSVLPAQHPCAANPDRFLQDPGARTQATPITPQFNAFYSLWQLEVA